MSADPLAAAVREGLRDAGGLAPYAIWIRRNWGWLGPEMDARPRYAKLAGLLAGNGLLDARGRAPSRDAVRKACERARAAAAAGEIVPATPPDAGVVRMLDSTDAAAADRPRQSVTLRPAVARGDEDAANAVTAPSGDVPPATRPRPPRPLE